MKDFLITEFGARECDKMQTAEIQAALDACFLAGGGRVIVPCGLFYTGGLRLRSNTTLYLESGAILRASRNYLDYMAYREDKIEPLKEPSEEILAVLKRDAHPYSDWNSGLIKVISARNVSIIGERGSYIDGQDCYNPNGEGGCRGPHAINMFDVENITLEGYTVINSANWAHNIYNSKNITARNLKVLGGHDGFDVRSCDDITVEDCIFKTGDDAIAGFDNKNVTIKRCVFDCACSALRFGGTDVLIEDCKGFAPSSYGFRMHLLSDELRSGMPTNENCRHTMHTPFQYYCDFRARVRYIPGNIVIRDCDFENPNALLLYPYDGMHRWCCNRPLSSLRFENCRITGLSLPAVICSDTEEPLELVMKNCLISSREDGADFPIFEAVRYKRIVFENVEIKGFSDPYAVVDSTDRVTVLGGDSIKLTVSNELPSGLAVIP